MSFPLRLALVPEKVSIDWPQLTRVAAALSKQVDQDFKPIWKVLATVDAFSDLESVPTDYLPIIIVQHVQGAAGYHEDKNGQPFALVEYGDQWSLTASHECLEMLADPFGRRMHGGHTPDQAVSVGAKPGRVNYLVEACDPCEAADFAYKVNGVLVSDFYTRRFFDPVKAPGARYSFTGAIKAPREVLTDGYLSWHDPVTRDWYQLRMFADNVSTRIPHVINLSKETNFESLRDATNLRSAIDRVTPQYRDRKGAGVAEARVARELSPGGAREESMKARAAGLREAIRSLPPRESPSSGGGGGGERSGAEGHAKGRSGRKK